MREIALKRSDLALKYVKDTLLKQISEPHVLAKLLQKVIKSSISVSDILGLTRLAAVKLSFKAF